jgi:hypothetical protein
MWRLVLFVRSKSRWVDKECNEDATESVSRLLDMIGKQVQVPIALWRAAIRTVSGARRSHLEYGSDTCETVAVLPA